MKAAFLGAAVLATAGVVFYFGTAVHAAQASGPVSAERRSAERSFAAPKALSSTTISLPLFFEPNQGQTAPQVKFLAHGAHYGLFLTADEAVLELQHSAASTPPSVLSSQFSVPSTQASTNAVIRMRLSGANASARVSGASPLPGKSSYFIGNDPSKWRSGIPQFARVEYKSVYPGVDLVYYGNQGQLEYDFRVAPGAKPNQIALSFNGASAHIVSGDSGDSGDLVLSTASGDVRFHAPRVYQPAAPQSGNAEKAVAGSFRQLAGNKIGFTIGDYDHSRELVIDPTLIYSTYLGGTGTQGLVQIAVDANNLIYVAGSTNSTDFPLATSTTTPPNLPIQTSLGGPGAQNIFIAVINPSLQPPTYLPSQQLVWATYLGGSQTDNLAGIAVDPYRGIYVAGTTNSADFPTTTNAFQYKLTAAQTGAYHGFLSKITNVGPSLTFVYGLTYSTYLAGTNAAGTATDTVTGLAIDSDCTTTTQSSQQSSCNAYVTGVTTSTNPASDYFPANPNGYQTVSNSPGNPQFFASKINTSGSGTLSMIYSTYFGGGNFPVGADLTANQGGGIAVDPASTTPNMYITGTTNMLPVAGPSGPGFPLYNAEQSCLDESGKTTCTLTNPTNANAFVAKINPNEPGYDPVYSTYIGGSGPDKGIAIAVDSSSAAYVTGLTYSNDWACNCSGFQTTGYGGNGDAFIAKIGNLTNSVYPLNYFTYLGGSGYDVGNAIQVDSVGAVHVAGTTYSQNFPITVDTYQPQYGGNGDAFVALISTTESGVGAGDYSTYLGGSQLDQGTGIALAMDGSGATYVGGATVSANFPFPTSGTTPTPFQGQLNGSLPNAFVSKIGAVSQLTVTNPTTSPSPNPVAAGTQVVFTFNINNTGPDNATGVNFIALGLPPTGLAQTPTATTSSGSCYPAQGQATTIPCYIPTLAAGAMATVEVDATPSATITPILSQLTLTGSANANNSGVTVESSPAQYVNIVDFTIKATNYTPSIIAGQTATIQVQFCPSNPNLGYSGTVTPSQTTSPSMVTATTPTFTPTTVPLSGSGCGTTALTVATVARPVTTGSLLRRGSFYATWLPIGGLSLVGLGIGAGRKRRRWLVGVVLCLLAAAILLQPACGGASTSTSTPGGTQAGPYYITVTGTAGTGAVHTAVVQLQVN